MEIENRKQILSPYAIYMYFTVHGKLNQIDGIEKGVEQNLRNWNKLPQMGKNENVGEKT